jgi:conserved oligomeric Golgi complex subunit 8
VSVCGGGGVRAHARVRARPLMLHLGPQACMHTPPPTRVQDGGISSAKAGEGAALNSWVQHRLMHFVAALERRLPDVQDGASLASALEHCMYACSSLGRVGLDFGALLQPLFQDCAMRLFAARLVLAVDAFQARLDGHKWVEMPAPMFGRAKQQKPAGSSGSGGGDGGQPAQTTGDDDELAPPYELMEHVPLAVFANGALSALNELRHVALLPLASPAASALQASLERVAASLEHYRSTHSLSEQETRMFSAAARALPDVLARHLARALSALFPGAGAALRPAALVVPPDSGAL